MTGATPAGVGAIRFVSTWRLRRKGTWKFLQPPRSTGPCFNFYKIMILHFCSQKAGEESRRSQTLIPPRATGLAQQGPPHPLPPPLPHSGGGRELEALIPGHLFPRGCPCFSSGNPWTAFGNFFPLTFPSTQPKECLTFPFNRPWKYFHISTCCLLHSYLFISSYFIAF